MIRTLCPARPLLHVLAAAGLAVLASAAAPAAPPVAPPAAIAADPPQDKAHPATAIVVALPSHGVTLNALLLAAAGAGRHPTVLLLHGLPGFEQNMDLARALQRDGWNVLTFHYRGNWGSPGRYSFAHCVEDAAAALAWLRAPTGEGAALVDPARIVVIGHSLGGFAAAMTGGHDRDLAGVALISAAPLGGLGGVPRAAVVGMIESNVLNRSGIHAIGDTSAEELADEAIAHDRSWGFAALAPGLAAHPLLVVTSNDPFRAADAALAKDVAARPGARVTATHLDTDHSYNDQRIALETTILDWLHALP